MKSVWSRRVAVSIAVFLLVYGLVCGYFWATQRQHIFLPEPQLQTTPARVGMAFEGVRIPVGNGADGGELHGWWIPAADNIKGKTPTLLYLHGNFRNIGHNVEHAARLHSLGYNLLLIDYRGFGLSTGGAPSEAKVYEDAEAAWQYLNDRDDVAPQTSFIYGHSLGGAVAVDLASRHGDAAGLILEATFTSMMDMGAIEYGFLPIDLLLGERFDSQQKIAELHVPLLLIHGTWDAKIPVEMGKRLFELAPQPKFLQLIEGGEHSNSSAIAWIEYRTAFDGFVRQQHLPRPAH
ncbi:MAG: alpha/beta hydrolase [Gallionella sp.]|nr:alpha/beta hydrolase [Gallionella sp.]